MNKFTKALSKMWGVSDAGKEFDRRLEIQQKRIQAMIAQYEAMHSIGEHALMWKKDSEYRYLVANKLHCVSFFGIEGTYECIEYIKGKTDFELLTEIFAGNDLQNTFSNICSLSDKYTRAQKQQCHFIEAGVIDGEEFLFYSVKTPEFSPEGEYIGSLGNVADFSHSTGAFLSLLNQLIAEDKVEKLYLRGEVFCYAIKHGAQRCKIFNHVCPIPEESHTTFCSEQCIAECHVPPKL